MEKRNILATISSIFALLSAILVYIGSSISFKVGSSFRTPNVIHIQRVGFSWMFVGLLLALLGIVCGIIIIKKKDNKPLTLFNIIGIVLPFLSLIFYMLAVFGSGGLVFG